MINDKKLKFIYLLTNFSFLKSHQPFVNRNFIKFGVTRNNILRIWGFLDMKMVSLLMMMAFVIPQTVAAQLDLTCVS